MLANHAEFLKLLIQFRDLLQDNKACGDIDFVYLLFRLDFNEYYQIKHNKGFKGGEEGEDDEDDDDYDDEDDDDDEDEDEVDDEESGDEEFKNDSFLMS